MNKWLLGFLLFFQSTAFAQIEIQGRILDKDTQEPMPFTFLVKKRTGTGAITNEDGYFSLKCQFSDTLTISYIGYQSADVPATFFSTNEVFYLEEKASMLPSVSVIGKVDIFEYLAIFKTAKRKLLAAKPYQSKTYFTLESKHDNKPIELLECYYNAKLSNAGIESLILKNGRIGLSQLGSSFFVSLYTTYVIERFNLLYKKNSEFPYNPLHFSVKKIKKLFHVKLVSLTDQLFVLEFRPKKKNDKLFNTKVWVDHKLKHIVKVKVWRLNIKSHPFVEIDAKHKIDSMNFSLAYSFDNSERQLLNKLEFKYDFRYDNTVTKRRIASEGIFLFYEKDALFDLPFYSAEESFSSDYDKIVNQPHNPQFWKFNEVLSPSERVSETKAFFEKNGLLFNFSELQTHSPIFKNKVMPWDIKRIKLTDINGTENYQLSPEELDVGNEAIIRSNLYEFSYGIYLDRNKIDDSIFFTARTLINYDKSFYYLKANRFTECLINMVFDIVEIQKRQMVKTLSKREWSLNQVDSIYNLACEKSKTEVENFIKSSDHGSKESTVLIYISKIDSALSVDNKALIRSRITKHDNVLVRHDINEIYNISHALVSLGKYEIALNVLKVGLSYGDVNPRLYYNLGICYYHLQNISLACENFSKAEENGEFVETLFKDLCH